VVERSPFAGVIQTGGASRSGPSQFHYVTITPSQQRPVGWASRPRRSARRYLPLIVLGLGDQVSSTDHLTLGATLLQPIATGDYPRASARCSSWA